MMSTKLATLGLLEIKPFGNNSYDVITSVFGDPIKFYHATQIIL